MINRIQNYIRKQYTGQEVVIVPPFTIYFSQSNDGAGSTAVPNRPLQDDNGSINVLKRVHEKFAERGLPFCLQYIDKYAPALTDALRESEFTLHARQKIMGCTPDSYRPVPSMPGLSSSILSKGDDVEKAEQVLSTGQLGFSAEAMRMMNKSSALFQQTLFNDSTFILRLNEKIVTKGVFTAVYNGVTELGCITTDEAFRQRGFGAYLTGYMTQIAFSRNVDLVFLILPKGDNINVYKRVGFRPQATLLTYGVKTNDD